MIETPEEFAGLMEDISIGFHSDPERCHRMLDELMVELLRKLGYGDAMDIFEESPKWYA